MLFVKPQVIPVEEPDLQKKVERAYRICYRSEANMKEGSASLISRLLHEPAKPGQQHSSSIKHTSPLAHAMIRIEIPLKLKDVINERCHLFKDLWNTQHFFEWAEDPDDDRVIMTTNFRALFELFESASASGDHPGQAIHGDKILWVLSEALHAAYPYVFKRYSFDRFPWETTEKPSDTEYDRDEQIKILGEPDNYHTFHIITTRDILQEIARHTTLWPSVESTRYCNYAKKGIVFTIPEPYEMASDIDLARLDEDRWMLTEDEETRQESIAYENDLTKLDNFTDIYLQSCRISELLYHRAIEIGVKPEQARMVLTGGLKTELLLTGVDDAWFHFLDLRMAKDAHPQIRILAQAIYEYFDTHPF